MTERVYDPVLLRIGRDWLAQYARFLRKSPETVERLLGQADEFEHVPVPKDILNHLAVPGIESSGDLGGSAEAKVAELMRLALGTATSGVDLVSALHAARAAPCSAALDAFRALAAAVEAGDLDAAMARISRRYVDADGRSVEDVRRLLAGLCADTAERRLVVAGWDEEVRTAGAIRARAQVAWTAARADAAAARIEERFSLELELERETDEAWRITCLRSR